MRNTSNVKIRQPQKMIIDEGQEFEMNETGLIDRKRTEKLFNKRNNQDKKDD